MIVRWHRRRHAFHSDIAYAIVRHAGLMEAPQTTAIAEQLDLLRLYSAASRRITASA
jgi:hypothetical protein